MNQTANKRFYDLDKIKSIPILDVCNAFGIDLERKGGSIWCKVRPERTASVTLHPEKNIYHDFGTGQTSDVIGLVSVYLGIDRGAAIEKLAEAFCVSPENTQSGRNAGELTVWEYEKIGLDGKMATKNFDFDLSRQSMERVSELSLRYAMPMNVLKKTNPRIYERLLKQRAIPHVRDLRNEYYMDVFARYHLGKAIGSEELFNKAAQNGEFAEQIKELQTAERILKRACFGTQIEAWPVGEYDPAKDLKKILDGTIKISLGNASYPELKNFSTQENSPVKYRTVALDGFWNSFSALKDISHSAFMKDGNVVVGFLEKDMGKIKPILDKIRAPSKTSLNQKISSAQQRSAQQASDSFRKGAQIKENGKGEER